MVKGQGWLIVDSRLIAFNAEIKNPTASRHLRNFRDRSLVAPQSQLVLSTRDTVSADSGSCLEVHEQLVGVVAMSEQ